MRRVVTGSGVRAESHSVSSVSPSPAGAGKSFALGMRILRHSRHPFDYAAALRHPSAALWRQKTHACADREVEVVSVWKRTQRRSERLGGLPSGTGRVRLPNLATVGRLQTEKGWERHDYSTSCGVVVLCG